MNVLKRIWRLTLLCIKGQGGKVGLVYCGVILLLNLAGIKLGLEMIKWNKNFYGALGELDAQTAIWQVGVFTVLVLLTSAQYVSTEYIRKLVQIRWRTTLTEASLDKWMDNKAYWHLNSSETSRLDNPDQRISEDCKLFVERLTNEGLDLFTKIIGLVTFTTLLWQLSDFPLTFTLFEQTVTIPRYLVWAAPLYVLICSGLTHWLGAPLIKLNVQQQHKEADMRFALTHFRESKEAIALENGEVAERRFFDNRFNRIVQNWRQIINRELVLNSFIRPYQYSVLHIPTFLALPAFLAGHVALGGLMQLGKTFQSVVINLSWFILSYQKLAQLAATSNRLDYFFCEAEKIADCALPLIIKPSVDKSLHIRYLVVRDPQDEVLLQLPSLDVDPGTAVWLEGPSGVGKSTLLKTIAGLWLHCEGSLEKPEGSILFLPQKPYLPLGSLAAAVTYPQPPEDMGEVKAILESVGLTCPRHQAHLDNELELAGEYNLSGGELQRLMVARVLATKPDWVFLDEATSALDAKAEKELYALLRQALPKTGFVVIAHREPAGLGQYHHVDLRECVVAKERKTDDIHGVEAGMR